nr:unnamed protein product [Naegleria fowleri]
MTVVDPHHGIHSQSHLTNRNKKSCLNLGRSWFMLLRRLYLTYNVGLTAFLVLLEGISFGLQLFYVFHYVDTREVYSYTGRICIQFSVIGMIGVSCFVFSLIIAKCVQLVRISFIHSFPCCPCGEAPRWIDISFQALLILFLELLPVFIAILTLFITPTKDFLSNFSVAFQNFITSGFLFSFIFVITWWIGSLVENWKRLIMFVVGRRDFFEKLRATEYFNTERKVRKLSISKLGANNSSYGTSQINQENIETNQDQTTGPIITRPRSSSSLSSKSDFEYISDKIMTDVSPSSRDINTLNSSAYNRKYQDEDQDEDELTHQSEKLYEIEKERNVWVILAWYCCLAGIKFPSFTAIYYTLKKCIRPNTNDHENRDKRKMSLKMSYFWALLTFGLMVLVICLLGVFHISEVFLIVTVVLVCLVVNTFSERYFFIPVHMPSKDKLIACWKFNEKKVQNKERFRIVAWLDKYITFVEEVFYHSPHVIYKASKFLLFTFTVVIALCITFKFTETYLTFFIPWSFCLLVYIFQVLRFNLHKWWDKILACFGRTSLKSEQTSEPESSAFIKDLYNEPTDEDHNVPAVISKTTNASESIHILSQKSSQVDIEEIPMATPPLQRTSISSLTFNHLSQKSSYYRNNIPPHYHCLFACFIVFLFILGAVFVLGGLNASASSDDLYWSRIGYHPNETVKQFDICANSWHGYSIIDFALLSALSYEIDPYFSHDLRTWFPSCQGCYVRHRENETINFFDLYVPSKNLSIISVRGTTIPRDVVQDFDVWKEAGLLQIAAVVGPFAVWPQPLLTNIVWYVSQMEKLTMVQQNPNSTLEETRYYYQILDDYVADAKKDRNIILCGHSLGGGLAKIVGSRNAVQAVTFSGPGVMLSRMKFDITQDNIDSYSVSVKPAVDLVAQIDIDGGLVQHIECPYSFVTCHSIVRTTRELIKSCGDYPLNRWIEGQVNATLPN